MVDEGIENGAELEPAAGSGAAQGAPDGAAAAAESEPDYPAIIAQLEAELVETQVRADDLREQQQRMAAEFQNSQRRRDRQLAEEIERASAHLLKRLLPIVDDFDLAFANAPQNLDGSATWVEGFRAIQRKLHALLVEEGVVMTPAEGEFDPTLHEAIGSEPSETVASGYIIATLRPGYTYKGRLLRPALVRVAI